MHHCQQQLLHALQALVKRYLNVEVTGVTPDGEPLTMQASGWKARILQHEYDHLQVQTLSAIIKTNLTSVLRCINIPLWLLRFGDEIE